MPGKRSLRLLHPTIPRQTTLSITESRLDRLTLLLLGGAELLSERCHARYRIHQDATPPTAQLLANIWPDVVVFPLISAQSDAVAILEDLAALGYRGRCAVLLPALPNPAMIRAELRRHARNMRLTLLNTAPA